MEVGSFHATTFQREAENWLASLANRCSPGHYRRSYENLDNFNRTYGNFEPNKITPEFLTVLQTKLKERPGKRTDTKWSNSSVNKYTEAICAVLNFSAEHRRIPFNPVAGFQKLPKNSQEMAFWEEDEARSFLAWASQKYLAGSNDSKFRARKNYVAYLLAINTGMRAGEIWGLKPHDLILNDGEAGDTIFVRRQLNTVTRKFTPLKGGSSSDKDKSRHVPCPRELRKELEALSRYNQNHPDQTIFLSSNGTPVNHDSFADRFDRDIRKWGGRRIRFHDLRHTAATLMLSKGIDVKTVSEILGHESITTTMIYLHLLGNKVKQVSRFFAIEPAENTRPRLFLVSNP